MYVFSSLSPNGGVSCSENFQKKFRDLTLDYQEGYFKSKIKKKKKTINPLSESTMVYFPGGGVGKEEKTFEPD